MAEPPSSPPNADASPEESLAWYKNQYEQLAIELAEFRESSHELEQELEKDLEAADKRERVLQERAEAAQFAADEWKEKCKAAKTEANTAHNALEKEITTLRDTNRTLQLKIRDMEVANDDFERQARHTTSSLEDMESKYNQAIERTVMMEEEIKIGEQERETLRIEAQRLREELSDLKIEAEILQDKIKKAENRHLSAISTDILIPESPSFIDSPRSTASSPMITTPPDMEVSLPTPIKAAPTCNDPPSPPMSDASTNLKPAIRSTTTTTTTTKTTKTVKATPKTPAPSSQKKSRLPSTDHSTTPKPRALNSSTSSNSSMRPPGTRAATQTRTPAPARTTTNRATSQRLPTSTSLTHIRSLTAQMQRLEARVQSARSKLPAPVNTPPRASPRSSVIGGAVPSTVTVRSRKRTIGSIASSSFADETPTQSTGIGKSQVPRLSTSGVSRLSFGPAPNRNSLYDPDSSAISMSRPSSRASVSSGQFVKPERPPSRTDIPRPMSRNSVSGAKTTSGIRPRSSIGSSFHGHSSINGRPDFDEMDEAADEIGRTPSRSGRYSKLENGDGGSGISTPSGIPMPGRRQSGGVPGNATANRRTSGQRKLGDLGETF